jgi:hypothetical protein
MHQHMVMANAVQHSVDSAMQRLAQMQAPPPAQAQISPIANATFPFNSPAQVQISPVANAAFPFNTATQQQPSVAPHPGLDTRGPFWHVHGAHLQCRFTPCTAHLFCQGCGLHGHTSADCRRRNHPNWNASGYYSDRHPNTGGLAYSGPPRQPPQQPPASPPAQMPVYQHPVPPQPRIPPPPPAFATPHRINHVQRSHIQQQSTVQVNASTQSAGNTEPPAL